MSTLSSFKYVENKHGVCRGIDCMKKFCEALRGHSVKIINFKKKKMKLLTSKHENSYDNVKSFIIVKKSLKINILKIKNTLKSEIIFVMQVNKEVLHIAYVV